MPILYAIILFTGQTAPPVEYTVSLPAPQTQMVDLSVRVRDIITPAIDFVLPVWRPGRYTVLDPAGSIRAVRASGPGGDQLPVEKIDKTTWRVTTRGASDIRVDYRLYANSLRDRTRHVDDTHAFLSGSCVFLYAPERRRDRVEVKLVMPKEWHAAGGLEPHPTKPDTLVAANYDVLIDSPLELGIHDVLTFEVDGKPHEIVIWGSVDYDDEQLTTDFAKVVGSCQDVFGDLPYKRYVFLLHVGAGGGGGTEHLNSTIIQTSRRSLEDPKAYKRFLGVVSHEMFHTWNVKQLRPAGIQPYDYVRENYTKLLWVSEGTTSYYGGLLLVRAGLRKPKQYLDGLASSIGRFRNRPGRLIQSLEESSFDAWIKFTRRSSDDANSTVSFYSKGSLVSLLLDMEVRTRTDNRITLDDVMKSLYRRFPLGAGGFKPKDLIKVVGELTGSDFDPFFAKYVSGLEPLPFEPALSTVGLELYFEPAKDDEDEDDEENETDDGEETTASEAASATDDSSVPQKAYLGLNLTDRDGRTTVRSALSDGPAYQIGLIAGDEIVALDGRRLRASEMDDRLSKLEPGQSVTLTIMRNDLLRTMEVTLAGRPDGTWKLRRVKEPTEAQRQAYESWLGQPWPAKKKKKQSDDDS